MTITYNHGFGNHFQTEAEQGALPTNQNSPQIAPMGLYAEQINGSAFTAPRDVNLYAWLYRLQPSVVRHDPQFYKKFEVADSKYTPPTAMRWDAPPKTSKQHDFIDGLQLFASNHSGGTIYLYSANQSMHQRYFYNADGEMLIVPQQGKLVFKTEMGVLEVSPNEIILIPRGVVFQVDCLDDYTSGYICENHGAPYRLPNLGPIGANGLAHPRHFCYPTAAYENLQGDYIVLSKFQNTLWQAQSDYSPLNVVAWHGNYSPYKYDLTLFNTINTVSFDHPDPSIFTVLTSPSQTSGIANIDFVIFPPRWMVAENTFRPPYYHRNVMNEFMGLIHGVYDAKQTGFLPGGCSLHNCMTPHGPDTNSYKKASSANLQPERYENTLAFMFESNQIWELTESTLNASYRQKNYTDCWQGLAANTNKKETAY